MCSKSWDQAWSTFYAFRYPVVVLPWRDNFNWEIKDWSSNIKVSTLDMKISRFDNIHTKMSVLRVSHTDPKIAKCYLTINKNLTNYFLKIKAKTKFDMFQTTTNFVRKGQSFNGCDIYKPLSHLLQLSIAVWISV